MRADPEWQAGFGAPVAVVSISGGKDSNATALRAIAEYGHNRVQLVHADTGHEHPETVDYVQNYLPAALGLPITTVRADFTRLMAGKRAWIEKFWSRDGVSDAHIARALELIQPTGNPFLYLCLWKGRFPSRKAQFCTQELKAGPMDQHMIRLIKSGLDVESWQGVRRDESRNRAMACAMEWQGLWLIRRPIAGWTAERVLRFAAAHGVQPNPLYRQGMGRVGCMPCINCTKDELLEISKRWPGEVDRVSEWERLVSEASKRGASTFFCETDIDRETPAETFARLSIRRRVEWAGTTRGGKQMDMERAMPAAECSSIYGLCE